MGASASNPRPATDRWLPDEAATLPSKAAAVPEAAAPPTAFVVVERDGSVTPATAASPAHLAAVAGIPERDARLLLPPSPPLTSPSGATVLSGPAMLVRRGPAWVVALDDVRCVAAPDRVLVLACPARAWPGLGGAPPDPGDELVANLAAVIAATDGRQATPAMAASSTTPVQAAAVDWCCLTALASLEARSAVLAADVAAAGSDLVDAVSGRGRGGGGGWTVCFCCGPPAPGARGGDAVSAAARRLRQAKADATDLESVGRQVRGVLEAAAARHARRVGGRSRRRRGGGGGGGVCGGLRGRDEAGDIFAAAAARAGWAAGAGAARASSVRGAETAARLALKRRALACGGA